MSATVRPVALRAVGLVVMLAVAGGLVATAPQSVVLPGLALAAMCAVAPLCGLSNRTAMALAGASGLVFGIVHVAESVHAADPSRSLADPRSLLHADAMAASAVWLPAVLALPVFVAVTATARQLVVAIGSVGEVLRRSAEIIDMLTPEDVESGALTRQHGLKAVRTWLAVGRRHRLPVTLALVVVDPPPGVDVRREGVSRLAASLGQVLRDGLEPTDLSIRLGPHSFMVVLPLRTMVETRALVGGLLSEGGRRTGRPVRASMVEFPTDGDDLDDLLSEAEAAMDFCREVGLTLADRQLLAKFVSGAAPTGGAGPGVSG